MNDAGRNGIQEIAKMQRSITAAGSGTRILAPAAWSAFFTDPLTDEAVNVFEQASHAL